MKIPQGDPLEDIIDKNKFGVGGEGLRKYGGRMPPGVWGANAPRYLKGLEGECPLRIHGGWVGWGSPWESLQEIPHWGTPRRNWSNNGLGIKIKLHAQTNAQRSSACSNKQTLKRAMILSSSQARATRLLVG